MLIGRRVALAAAGAVALAGRGAAQGGPWPTRTVRIVVVMEGVATPRPTLEE